MVAAIEDLASLDVAISEFQAGAEGRARRPAHEPLARARARDGAAFRGGAAAAAEGRALAAAAGDAFHYLGRCLLALDRPAEAMAALTRALELAGAPRPRGLAAAQHPLPARPGASRARRDATRRRAFRRGRAPPARLAETRARASTATCATRPSRCRRSACRCSTRALSPALSAEERASLRARARDRDHARLLQPRRAADAGRALRTGGRRVREGGSARSRLPAAPVLARRLLVQRAAVRQGGGAARARARREPGDQSLRRMLALGLAQRREPTQGGRAAGERPRRGTASRRCSSPTASRSCAADARPRPSRLLAACSPSTATPPSCTCSWARRTRSRATTRVPSSRWSARSSSSRTWPRRTARSG